MSSVRRAALLGGLVGLALHLLVLLVVRNILWIALAVGMLFLLDRCQPGYPEIAAARALRDSFDASKVTLSQIVGVTEPDGYVGEIAMSVTNSERARIYDLKAICSYLVRGERERYWTTTDFHYGFLAAGTQTRIRLQPTTGINLGKADPNSFECNRPLFEVEKSDLFRTGQ